MASDSRLAVGDLLTQNEGEAWYVVTGLRMTAIEVCRVPPGMLPKDYGRTFAHCPAPDDPAAYELYAPAPAVMQ